MDKTERGPHQLLKDLDSALDMDHSEILAAHRMVLKTFLFILRWGTA
jgi:hypothetical protein